MSFIMCLHRCKNSSSINMDETEKNMRKLANLPRDNFMENVYEAL